MKLDLAKKAFQAVSDNGVAGPIFNLFQGRCTFFAIVFSAVGIILALHGKLDANYALFVGSIQGLLVLHSWKEDIAEQRAAEREIRKGVKDGDGRTEGSDNN